MFQKRERRAVRVTAKFAQKTSQLYRLATTATRDIAARAAAVRANLIGPRRVEPRPYQMTTRAESAR